MYNALLHTHSLLRWVLLISMVFTISMAVYSRISYKPFSMLLKKMATIAFMTLNIQFLIGIILYTISPKVIFSSLAMKSALTRFFLVEHLTAMFIAIALISIGYAGMKRATTDALKYRKLILFYIIGFLIMLLAIPWPFYGFGSNWL